MNIGNITETDYVWLIAYINSDNMDRIEHDIKKIKKGRVIPYIPTIRVLKKTFKNEQHFEIVPFLLNYGFFLVPRNKAVHQKFLDDIKQSLSCIYGWVKDTTKDISTKHTDFDTDDWSYPDSQIPVATATFQEIFEIEKAAYYSSLYSSEDLGKLQPGNMVTLKGYPYDDVIAEIVEIMPKKQKIRVSIDMFQTKKTVEVAYDNVLFTVYHNRNWDDSLSSVETLEKLIKQSVERHED